MSDKNYKYRYKRIIKIMGTMSNEQWTMNNEYSMCIIMIRTPVTCNTFRLFQITNNKLYSYLFIFLSLQWNADCLLFTVTRILYYWWLKTEVMIESRSTQQKLFLALFLALFRIYLFIHRVKLFIHEEEEEKKKRKEIWTKDVITMLIWFKSTNCS